MTTFMDNAMNHAISSIGNNFKGVMLCNRPYEGVALLTNNRTENVFSKNSNGGSFICGTVKKPWGRNVVISEKSRVLCRLSYKDSALSKHKKWLSDLQKEREISEIDVQEDQKVKDVRMREFKEREARKRVRALSSVVEEKNHQMTISECEEFGSEEEKVREGSTYPQHAPSLDKEVPVCCHTKRQHNNQQQHEDVANLLLPAWALTESKTELAKTASVQLEHEELLSFVNELDFDKFENDLELGALMNQVKERIKSLEKEKQKDEARLRVIEECEIAAEKSMEFNKVDVFDAVKTGVFVTDPINGDDEDVRSIAGTVISSKNGLMGYIHSRKSAEALVEHAKERFVGNKPLGFCILDTVAEKQVLVVEERTCSPPAMVTHKDDEGARLAVMKSLQKLPFMNRNPAI